MAQIIRHRKGVIESVSGATKRKAELLIVTGSSGITSTNSSAMVFFGDGTDATPANKIIYGTSTPDLTGASYSTAVDGVPYYNTSEEKLYILAKGGNTEVKATANTGGTNIVSGSGQISIVTDGTNVYSSSTQVAADLLSDNRNIDLGTGNFDANSITADGSLNVSGLSSLGVISGSALSISGNALIKGNLTLGGNITIGDASGDTISFGGEISSDIIPSDTNQYDLGSATDKFAEVHATTIFGSISATNGVVSGSSQTITHLQGSGVVSGSSQTITHLQGSGVVSGSTQLDGTTIDSARLTSVEASGSFSGSFFGDGSGITGLSTDLTISGSDGSNDTVALLEGALSFAGGTGVSATVATDTVTISVQDGSTSVKGIASFDADDFSVTSGNVVIKSGDGSSTSGGVRGANLNADTAGDGLTYSLSNQQLDVDYGSTSGTAVQGNTTISVSGTANEIEITGTTAQALGGGASYTIGLPDAVTIATASIQNDLSVGGNAVITGNLSVLGTTTTIDSTTVQIGDNILELNYGGAQATAGLQVSDSTGGSTVSGSLLYDGATDKWTAGVLGSEKEIAILNAAPTANTVLKADANGLLVDSVLTDDGTDATFSGDVIVTGLTASSFLYVDGSKQLTAITPSNAGDVIQWDGSSFVASNELDGGTF